jgi:hypothetical protein
MSLGFAVDGPLRGKLVDLPADGGPVLCDDTVGPRAAGTTCRYQPVRFAIAGRVVILLSTRPDGPAADDVWDLLVPEAPKQAIKRS